MERQVWWNGKLINESEAKISIYDSALMFGDMCFEMTRSFNKNNSFKLHEHIHRLIKSMKFLSIPVGFSVEYLAKACIEVCKENERLGFFKSDDEHRLMINVSRGLLSIYEGVNVPKGPNVIIADFPLRWTVKNMGKLYKEGVSLVVPNQKAIPSSLLENKLKVRSRVHLEMANIEASRFKGENNWPLLFDPDGFAAEGSGFNFFIVKDNVVYTPEPRNILRGISREFVMNELCNDIHKEFKCVEKNIEIYDIYNADEAFITATPFCILPVKSLNFKNIGYETPGAVTQRLTDKWIDKVDCDFVKQTIRWNESDQENNLTVTPYQFKEN